MFPLLVALILASVFFVLRLGTMEAQGDNLGKDSKIENNGSGGSFVYIWHYFIDQYGLPFGQVCIGLLYAVYMNFTLFNVTIFMVKYVPTGLYMCKFLRSIYVTSRDRVKEKQIELEDIQLQIEIVNTKLSVRDTEFTERAKQLRRDAERLRRVRERVRDIIAADESLRRALNVTALWDPEQDINVKSTPDQGTFNLDRVFIAALLKGPKYENAGKAATERKAEMLYGECVASEPHTPENSVYSSLSDIDVKQDCRVKIIKVTNVYKVAYLKHFIKQKRLRRAHKHALLKKRMESIKKLLEDWQESLNMAINNKLSILNMESRIDKAMGDYSKPTAQGDSCDSDSDFRNSSTDVSYDEHNFCWTQNPYRTYNYGYEDTSEVTVNREYQERGEPQDFAETKYPPNFGYPCEYHDPHSQKLSVLPEETISQVAIEEAKSESDELMWQDQGEVVA